MLEHILLMDWSTMNDVSRTTLKFLIEEYLIRSFIWANELGHDVLPFADFPALINNDIRASKKDLDTLRAKDFPNLGVRITCEYFLHWDKLKKNEHVQLPQLPDLYEPLVKFYLRGGYLVFITGGIDIYSWRGAISHIFNYNLKSYKDRQPNLDLSDERIDKMKD